MAEPGSPAPPLYLRAQRYVADRVTAALEGIRVADVERVLQVLTQAPLIFVYGAGRSGIIGRAFAMRLVQTGLRAFVIGESVTPIVQKGDAVFIFSAQGESYSSIQTANIVRREGADLVVLTARGNSKLAHTATVLLALDFPEDPERARLAPLGTLFESASLRLTDGIIAQLLVLRGESEDSMRRRHAIMV
jgi:6-phospho 3-hexuloisomerase